jgi:hypothetical protein
VHFDNNMEEYHVMPDAEEILPSTHTRAKMERKK